MKYMGSKRQMLNGYLGQTLIDLSKHARRFIDLFSGSGAVSWFVAAQTNLPVTAVDIQAYSKALADAVILRRAEANTAKLVESWLSPARSVHQESDLAALVGPWNGSISAARIFEARHLCDDNPSKGNSFWGAYGGYYYSPHQALAFDAMRETLPEGTANRALCTAAMIWAATRCAASPGHTAQPFSATSSALPYIHSAWQRDPYEEARAALDEIGAIFANEYGTGVVANANDYADNLRSGDLVFVDPPYSSVQYSRFYHVLESVCTGVPGPVSGTGRYPDLHLRPQSSYSLKSRSAESAESLLRKLAARECVVVLTFPRYESSNGLAGDQLVELGMRYFAHVDARPVSTRMSTLGGNGVNRSARRSSTQLVMTMYPRGLE